MAGRKPLPTNIKALRGTLKPSRLNPNEPRPDPLDANAIPPGLDRYGRECWRRLAPMLAGMGIACVTDSDLLALLCDAYSQWRRSARALHRIKPEDEQYRKVAVSAEHARDQLRLLAGEFGLSPSSRSKVKATPETEEDPFDLWEKGHRA